MAQAAGGTSRTGSRGDDRVAGGAAGRGGAGSPGRTLAIRHINTGSCNGCELELRALSNVLYDLERFGLRFVDTPRHADILLVTGPLTRNLRVALEQAWDATPDPKWVVALGDCAIDGGIFKESYAVLGGTGLSVPVDLTISGCPPSPNQDTGGIAGLAGGERPLETRATARGNAGAALQIDPVGIVVSGVGGRQPCFLVLWCAGLVRRCDASWSWP